jgi:hypothetical protein
MQPKLIILDWAVTGVHPKLIFRRSADNLILDATGAFVVNPALGAGYPVMTEDSIIMGRYYYDMSAIILNDGEYTYCIYDPVNAVNIGTGELYVFQNSFVMLDVPVEEIVQSIQTLGGDNSMFPFISVQSISISEGSPVDYISGDTKPLNFYLPSSWNVSGKYVWLCIKKNKTDSDALAIIDALCTNVTSTEVTFTPTIAQTSYEGLYYGELAQYDDALGTINPQTAMEFLINFTQRVRDL